MVVGGQEFHTSQETLTCVEGSRLATLMSSPYPLLDPDRDIHVLPRSLCRTARAFAIVLEYLRGPPIWPFIANDVVYNEVHDACEALGLPLPPRPYPAHKLRPRYEHTNVLIPHIPTWVENIKGRSEILSHSSPATFLNSCAMISSLTAKGFLVRKEVHVDAVSSTRVAMKLSGDDILRASLGDAIFDGLSDGHKDHYRKKLRRTCTAVVLERRKPHLQLLDSLSTMSAWAAVLTES